MADLFSQTLGAIGGVGAATNPFLWWQDGKFVGPAGAAQAGYEHGEKVVSDIGGAISGVGKFITGQGAVESAQAASRAQQAELEKAGALFQPYQEAGTGSLQQQQALLGLLGPEAQKAAISSIQGSPQYQAMLQQGEQAILQNAAATGGLRGGNVQAALATFRPQLLSDLINQQYARLGGLTGLGAQVAGQQADIFGQLGAARAGELGAPGQMELANRAMLGNILGGAAQGGAQLASDALPAIMLAGAPVGI